MNIVKFKTFDKILKPKEKRFSHALELISVFRKARSSSKPSHFYICGGFVRDMLMHISPKDMDFATNLSYNEIKTILSKHYKLQIKDKTVSLKKTGESFPVLRIRYYDTNEEYEIASFRQDIGISNGRHPKKVIAVKDPKIDAKRRDLTINAIFYNPIKGELIDYVGGLRDIKNKRLKFVGDPELRIEEDNLRALRYIRFLLKTGFKEDPKAKKTIQKFTSKIARLSSERIIGEFVETIKTVKNGHYGEILEAYNDFGLLQQIFPEIYALENSEQGPPYHMEGNVLTHIKMVCSNLPKNSSARLVLAAMYHDVCKPGTKKKTFDKFGKEKISFHGHAERGAHVAMQNMKRLKISTQNIESSDIAFLVENHIRAFSLHEMTLAKARLLAWHPLASELFTLAEADSRGSYPNNKEIKIKNNKQIIQTKERFALLLSEKETWLKLQKLVNGKMIISEYKRLYNSKPPGKTIGQIKARLHNWIMSQKKLRNITESTINKQLNKFLTKDDIKYLTRHDS